MKKASKNKQGIFLVYLIIFGWLLLALQSLGRLSIFGLRGDLILVYFVFIQQYLEFRYLLFVSFLFGLFIDLFFLSFPFGLLKFLIFALIVWILREKIFLKNEVFSLFVFLLLGLFVFNFSLNLSYFYSLSFIKELLFDTFLFIIVSFFSKSI